MIEVLFISTRYVAGSCISRNRHTTFIIHATMLGLVGIVSYKRIIPHDLVPQNTSDKDGVLIFVKTSFFGVDVAER
jgi:hypothetical protein